MVVEFSEVVIDYLKSSRINFNSHYVRMRIRSHPDYPTMVSMTDTFDELNIKYEAIQSAKENFYDLRYPLLAVCSTETETVADFVVVNSFDDFERNVNGLADRWNGISIAIQDRSITYSTEHLYEIKKERDAKLSFSTIFVILIFCVLMPPTEIPQLGLILFFILGILGLFVSYLITIKVNGRTNDILEKLCPINEIDNCEKVIKSEGAKIWNGFEFSDLGIVYFSATLGYIAIGNLLGTHLETFSNLLLVLSGSLFFCFFSIWYQWRVIQSWCKLCLIVVSILISQWITCFFMFPFFDGIIFSFVSLGGYVLALIAAYFIWNSIKNKEYDNIKFRETNVRHLQWKRDPQIFMDSLVLQKKYDTTPWKEDIMFGGKRVPIQLVIVINPFCLPCANDNVVVKKIYNRFPNQVQVIYRFAIFGLTNEKDPRSETLMNILYAHDLYQSNKHLDEPISAWFAIKKLDTYKTKYNIDNISEDYISVLAKHMTWSIENDVQKTPTIIFNGFELPNKYTISDIEDLILPISEIITSKNTVANVIQTV